MPRRRQINSRGAVAALAFAAGAGIAGSDEDEFTEAVSTVGNRSFNVSLLGSQPSLYALLRAYVQSDANNLRGAVASEHGRPTSARSAVDRRLPPVPEAAAEGTCSLWLWVVYGAMEMRSRFF